jgi:glycosyltransferase involved in cell wall biosynthesis
VLKQYQEATLDILGQGSMRAELETYVQEHNLTAVRFIGQVPNDKIYDYFANASIMLSAPKIDNMPVSLLEAMNAGLLVISSRVGGVPYMIEDGKTGLLFESENCNDLADKMTWALVHPQEVNTMIIAAQKEVQKYSWEKVKKQLFKVYI